MKKQVAVFMLNIGGPQKASEIQPFLIRFFSDYSIIQIPFGLGKYVGKYRSILKIQKQYEAIGYSPIQRWTQLQADGIMNRLNTSETNQYHVFPAFRYSIPLQEDQLQNAIDTIPNLQQIILFSQFPQYSCTTGGNSLRNMLMTMEKENINKYDIKVIDRWYNHPLYIKSIVNLVKKDIQQNFKEKPFILFTSHSLPVRNITNGDVYVSEISATVEMVMQELNFEYAYSQAWQSKVGFIPWMAPNTENALMKLCESQKNILLVPIGFTSDHLETLYELDLEYMGAVKEKFPDTHMVRSQSLNDDETFVEALSDIVANQEKWNSKKLKIRCPNCTVKECAYLNHY